MTDISGLAGSRHGNRLRVLNTLLWRPATSRAELGRRLGLSRATVTGLVGELEAAGIVEQHADDVAAGQPRSIGRPPLQLSLAPNAAFAVGLDFGRDHVRAALCNLDGDILADRRSAAPVADDPLEAFELARAAASAVLTESRVDPSRVIGAGAGFSMPVDSEAGSVHATGILPAWEGIWPAAELADRLGMPVRIENDANAGALGEFLFGAGRDLRHVAYLRLSAGVGLGLIINGRLYRGAAGVAGELGHVRVRQSGLICRCGGRGCLETAASPVAVADLLTRSRGEQVTIERMLELVASGDRGARRAVADAGGLVGGAVAATVNLLNPELVLVGGELARAGAVLLDPLREALSLRVVAPAADAVRIDVGSLGERSEVLGAASIQLSHAPEMLARRIAA